MLEIIKDILTTIGSDKISSALDNITKLFTLFGIIFGFFLAYLFFIRDLKFSVIKKIIEEDHENRKVFSGVLISYKTSVLTDSIVAENKIDIINKDFISKGIDEWKSLFEKSQNLNSEIANLVYLMYMSLLIIQNTVKDNEIRRTNFTNDFYNYYLGVIDLLLENCQKTRIFPSIFKVLFPFRKASLYNPKIDKLTTKSDLKTNIVSDIGINSIGCRRELLAYTSILQQIRNPLLAYSLDDCYDITTYLTRLMYINRFYTAARFNIKLKIADEIEYHLFRYENNIELITKTKTINFYYLSNIKSLEVKADSFYSSLKETKNGKYYILKDIDSGLSFRILKEDITMTKLYNYDMVKIRIKRSQCGLDFFKKGIIKRSFAKVV